MVVTGGVGPVGSAGDGGGQGQGGTGRVGGIGGGGSGEIIKEKVAFKYHIGTESSALLTYVLVCNSNTQL